MCGGHRKEGKVSMCHMYFKQSTLVPNTYFLELQNCELSKRGLF